MIILSLPFCVIYIEIMSNENTDTFRKGQVPSGLYISIQMFNHNDRHGCSSVN